MIGQPDVGSSRPTGLKPSGILQQLQFCHFFMLLLLLTLLLLPPKCKWALNFIDWFTFWIHCTYPSKNSARPCIQFYDIDSLVSNICSFMTSILYFLYIYIYINNYSTKYRIIVSIYLYSRFSNLFIYI